MTDDEIIAPGRLVFGHGGWIDVHEVWRGQVLYGINHPARDICDLRRMDIADFVACVRRDGGKRVRSQ